MSPPQGIDRFRQSSDARLSAAAQAFADKLVWPAKDGKPLPVKPPLSESQQHLWEVGQGEYATLCAGCHHARGFGLEAKGPPLLGSSWLEDEQRVIRVVLHGIQGPVDLDGEVFNADSRLSMPGMHATLDDEKIAGVLTYVRREFVDDAGPVDPATVAKLRKRFASRTEPWTEAELSPGDSASP